MARVSKMYTMLISSLLALLGFSGAGCGNSNQFGYAEYGSPSATYKVTGTAVSEADDTPIEGIRAELVEDITDVNPITIAYTDSNGSFSLEGSAFPHLKLYVLLTDVDGSENGSFAVKQIDADFTDATFTGGSGNWYEGKAEMDLGTIKMQSE